MIPLTTEEYCLQQNAKVLLSYPSLSCNQIESCYYIYREGRCQKLREIAAAVIARAAPSDCN